MNKETKKYRLKKDWLFEHGITGSCTYGAGMGLVRSIESPNYFLIECGGGVLIPASLVESNDNWFEPVTEPIEQDAFVGKWSDEDMMGIAEMVYWDLRNNKLASVPLRGYIEKYKHSKSTQPETIVEDSFWDKMQRFCDKEMDKYVGKKYTQQQLNEAEEKAFNAGGSKGNVGIFRHNRSISDTWSFPNFKDYLNSKNG